VSTEGKSKAWFDHEYANSNGDPWGLGWRPSQAFRYEKMLDVLRTSVQGLEQGVTVLDIGCATGAFTDSLRRAFRGCNVIGADFAVPAIERARVGFPDTHFEVMRLDEIDRRHEGQVYIVTLLEVLYYIPEAERLGVLERVQKCLASEGYVLVSSMVGNIPYFSAGQLAALVSQQFDVIDQGQIYAKPISFLEKVALRYARLKSRLGFSPDTWIERILRRGITVQRLKSLEGLFKRLLGKHAVSHVYVLAKKRPEV